MKKLWISYENDILFFPSDSIWNLFIQMVKYLPKLGEVEFKNLFVDGTKIEANANRLPGDKFLKEEKDG